MGALRLILALLVVLSHADWRVQGLNLGVTAVIGFYLVSGYVMAGLVHRHYAEADRVPAFYLDRLMRLLPQYLLYAAITLAWQLNSGTQTLFLSRTPGGVDLLNNLFIVPLNYYMFNGADAYTLIPPAWSLGAELQFYLLAPWMLLWPRLGLALAGASFVVHASAWFGVLNTDWFGYRLLPGVLWVFGAGMLMFHLHRTRVRWAWAVALAAPGLAAAVAAYLQSRGLLGAPYHREVLIGWALGLPLLHGLGPWAAPGALSGWVGRFDRWAGDVSYGAFLNHFLLIWWFFPGPTRSGDGLALLCLVSVGLSALSQWSIERPVVAFRRRLRRVRDAAVSRS